MPTSKKISVLSVYRNYYPDPPGGIAEAMRQICLATNKLGTYHTIFTLSENINSKVIIRPEAKVVRERSWFTPASCDIGFLSAFSQYQNLAKQSDILHYHFPWPFADILHLMSAPELPSVMTYHSDIVRQKVLGAFYSPIMNKMLDAMTLIVATSSRYAETSPVLNQSRYLKKVRIIPIGIDENTYSQEGDENVFQRIQVSKDEPYFLFLGVSRYYKGLQTLIKASKGLAAKVVIAGSGPESSKLIAQADNMGLKNIVFTGQVTNSEKVSLIKGCMALVLPSHLRSEAFGMVLVEASMFGKPMISCEIGTGTSFVNINQETGLVVQPENVLELNNAMQTLLNDNRALKEFGGNARLRYERLFSGNALGQAYKAVYDELLS